jgi:hypothetical protein
MLLRIGRIVLFLGYLLWALLAGPAEAQIAGPEAIVSAPLPTPSTTAPGWVPDRTVGDALRHLGDHAGVAFIGRVQKIELPPAAQQGIAQQGSAQQGVAAITFEVLQPVVGDPGPVYTVHEWAGLWTGGRQRYTVGQRALFFFHPVNAAGLTSPVDGMEGIVPLIPTTADASSLLDVRRLGTRILRRVGDPLPMADTGAITLNDAVAVLTRPGAILEPALLTLPEGVLPRPDPITLPRNQHVIAVSTQKGGAR